MQNALACAARVFELLDAEDQTPEAENAAKLVPDGHVQIEDVSFRYLPDRPLIEGLSLDVKPGQRIAIVGPTGCGKTTLINLLMRFYDVNGGSIEVAGNDIRSLTRASLRGSYGMVLQDTWLRAGTVRENIAYGKPDAPLDEVVAAAKAAHADSFIRRLPKGYDTVIAEVRAAAGRIPHEHQYAGGHAVQSVRWRDVRLPQPLTQSWSPRPRSGTG